MEQAVMENPIATLEQEAELAVNQYQTDAKGLAKRAKVAQLRNDDDIAACNIVITQARKLRKIIDAKRLEKTRPVNEELKRIKAIFDGITGALQDTENILIIKLNDYRAKRLQEQAEAEAAAQAEEERRRRIQESHAERGHKVRPDITPVQREPSFEAKDTTKVRKVWKHEVVDKTQLPAEFILADNVAIREVMFENVDPKTKKLNAGFVIPGVRFYQEEGWSS